MTVLESIIEEYRRIDGVQLWSPEEKAAARSILRGVVVRAGLYAEFQAALAGGDVDLPDNIESANVHEMPARAFGGFIRF